MQTIQEALLALVNVILVLLGTIILILFVKGLAFVMGDKSKQEKKVPAIDNSTSEFANMPREHFIAIISAAISEHSEAKGLRIHSVKRIK